MEKAAGGVAGSLQPDSLAASTVCPITQIHAQSAAGSSDGCYGSLFISDGSNQGNVFELTGLSSGVSKKTILQLLSRVVPH